MKNKVKGKKTSEKPKAFFMFAIITMIAEALIIVVLAMALVAAYSGPKYTTDSNGNVVKVREDRPVKYGKVEASDYVEGKTDSQAVFIWYVDMQCPACAQMAPVVQSLYEKYGDRVAFVTRNLLIPGHTYAEPAAKAVEAAARQDYQWDMTMELFYERANWAYVNSEDMLKDRFVEIFKTATNGNGNVDKFLADYADSSTSNKIKTDEKMVKADGLNATPTIVIGGNYIDFTQSGTSVVEMFETEIKKALGE